MSFVPTSGTRVQAGQGIITTSIGNVTQVATNLVGSPSVTITPVGGNTLQLTASAPGTLNTVTTGNGSGIVATLGTGTANLTSALVAGRGMELLPSGANKNLEVKNILTAGSLNGSGITVSPAVPLPGELRYNVETNLQAGTGVQITSSGANTSKTISNTGVTGITAGTGISASATTGNITLANAGVTSVVAGAGVAVSGGTGAVTVSLPNVGTAASYAYPTSITTDAQGRVSAAVAGAAPVASITAGAGITVGGTATVPQIANAGVLSVSAGSGVSIGGTAQNPIINSTSTGYPLTYIYPPTNITPQYGGSVNITTLPNVATNSTYRVTCIFSIQYGSSTPGANDFIFFGIGGAQAPNGSSQTAYGSPTIMLTDVKNATQRTGYDSFGRVYNGGFTLIYTTQNVSIPVSFFVVGSDTGPAGSNIDCSIYGLGDNGGANAFTILVERLA